MTASEAIPLEHRRTCKRCAQLVFRCASGHLRAHTCPHGAQCVVPYARRRAGEKPDHCALCSGKRDTHLEPGQMPMPFVHGIRKKLTRPRKPRAAWPLPGGGTGRVCPVCGCGEGVRCTVTLEDGSTAACVPAGTFGRKVCSGCRQPELFT